MEKKYYTIPELAKILGLSRIAVFNQVKRGKIRAEKIGRIYMIPASSLNKIISHDISAEDKKVIDKLVDRTVKEYGEVLRKLSRND